MRGDERLTSGRGRYVADLRVDGCREAAFVRSPVPHADLRGVDPTAARTMPGVEAVLTAADLTDVGETPTMFGAQDAPLWRPLATDRVRHEGEPVALVVADDRYRAEDAAAAVVLDLDRRPGRATPQAARDARDRGDAPLYPGHDDLALEKHFGPPVAEETWARAHTVVDVSLRQQLLAPTSLEARAILVEPGPDGSLTIHCSHQFPHGLATGVAGAFGLDAADVRVIVPDAGGAFGSKSPTYPEYLAVVAAARRLGVPVRWVEDRTEALTAASRGRGQDQHVRIAADADGRVPRDRPAGRRRRRRPPARRCPARPDRDGGLRGLRRARGPRPDPLLAHDDGPDVRLPRRGPPGSGLRGGARGRRARCRARRRSGGAAPPQPDQRVPLRHADRPPLRQR